MVIGNSSSQFTSSCCMISYLLVINTGSFIDMLLYSVFTHIFPWNSIPFLFTSWYLSFSGWISLILCMFWFDGMVITGEPVFLMNFVSFHLFLLRHRRDCCYPALFGLIAWCGRFIRVRFFWACVFNVDYFSWILVVLLPAAYACKVFYFLAVVAFHSLCRAYMLRVQFCCP